MENNYPRVFIGSLNPGITEQMITAIFEPFGKIESVNLILDRKTGQSMSFGFIRFEEARSAFIAASEMHGYCLAGIPMAVGLVDEKQNESKVRCSSCSNLGKDFTCLYIGGLSPHTTADMIEDLFNQFGPLSSVELSENADMTKFAFVKYEREVDGDIARKQLEGLTLYDKTMVIKKFSGKCKCNNNNDGEVRSEKFKPSSSFNPTSQVVDSQPVVDVPIACPCFVLDNLLEDEEDVREVIEEVRSEVSKWGEVIQIHVRGGRVWVMCGDVATGVAGVNWLHGRWFAGKRIIAGYVPLQNFKNMFAK